MRFPQVGERMREAPAQALRAMFAGIGQVLLVADRMRSRPAGLDADQPAAARFQGAAAFQGAVARRGAGVRPAADRLSPDGPPAAGPGGSRWRSLDTTGNVRILPVEYQPGRPAVPAAEPPSPAEPVPAEPVHIDKPGPAELPIPNYDDLSLASLRARLRTLDSGQLLMLLDYEKANAARRAVLTMFERRISKLETGQG